MRCDSIAALRGVKSGLRHTAGRRRPQSCSFLCSQACTASCPSRSRWCSPSSPPASETATPSSSSLASRPPCSRCSASTGETSRTRITTCCDYRVEAGPFFVPGLPHVVAHSRRLNVDSRTCDGDGEVPCHCAAHYGEPDALLPTRCRAHRAPGMCRVSSKATRRFSNVISMNAARNTGLWVARPAATPRLVLYGAHS